MGCKGKRRREKNYLAAHGGFTLAPPPTAKEMEAIPSKLRRLMELKNSSPSKKLAKESDTAHGGKKGGISENKKSKGKKIMGQNLATLSDSKLKHASESKTVREEVDNKLDVMQQSEVQRASSKRKRKRGDELHFLLENENLTTPSNRKSEHKKKYLDAKKKKHSKAKNDDPTDYPLHETIKFGEVVTAPPKLEFPKKATAEIKMRQDVSQERLRLQAIENYRHRKGWASRPGCYVPPLNTTELLSNT